MKETVAVSAQEYVAHHAGGGGGGEYYLRTQSH